jgi:hypothetical protein
MGAQRAVLEVIDRAGRRRQLAGCASLGAYQTQAIGRADLDGKRTTALCPDRVRPRWQHRASKKAAKRKKRNQPSNKSRHPHASRLARRYGRSHSNDPASLVER